MAYNVNNSLAELQSRAAQRPPPQGHDQFAAVNLMALMPEVMELMRKSRQGQKLPSRVPEDVYPGGVLPPGDVVGVKHYTSAPEDIQALDPAYWGSRAGEDRAIYGNAEGPRMKQNPDLYNTQFYLSEYPHTPESQITGQPGVRLIEGALPGMYNATKDPEGIYAALRASPHHFTDTDQALAEAFDREVRRRGYTGPYWEDTGQSFGAAGYSMTPVDLTGAAPNIEGMRANLGLDVASGKPETRYTPGSPYAQVTAETMPGEKYFADRYSLYKDSPSAGAMLHNDYEKLLRNPDNSSVVADMMGLSADVKQGQGIYKGQKNPLSAARIKIHKPRLDASMDIDQIAEKGRLDPHDRARMDALALTEGILRDQDAVAWSVPIHMTPERAMPIEGLPWKAVNSAIFRSPQLGAKEVAMVGDSLDEALPDKLKTQWADTWQDMISVSEPSDGSGGIMFTNVGGLEPKVFQDKVREMRKKHSDWQRSRNMETEWGRADTGYYTNDEFADAMANLPEDLQGLSHDTVQRLTPYVGQIRSYHDNLRQGQQAADMAKREQYEREAAQSRAVMERLRALGVEF